MYVLLDKKDADQHELIFYKIKIQSKTSGCITGLPAVVKFPKISTNCEAFGQFGLGKIYMFVTEVITSWYFVFWTDNNLIWS